MWYIQKRSPEPTQKITCIKQSKYHNTMVNVYSQHLYFLEELKRGEYAFRQKDGVVANVWCDKRLVYVMSTNVNATETETCNRKEKDGSTTAVPIPRNTYLYNKYMGGVDRADQYRAYYQLKFKSRKFYM